MNSTQSIPNASATKQHKTIIEDQWDIGDIAPSPSLCKLNSNIRSESATTDCIDLILQSQINLPCIYEALDESCFTPTKQWNLTYDCDDIIATYRSFTTYIDPNLNETEIDDIDVPEESIANKITITAPILYKLDDIINTNTQHRKMHRRTKAVTSFDFINYSLLS